MRSRPQAGRQRLDAAAQLPRGGELGAAHPAPAMELPAPVPEQRQEQRDDHQRRLGAEPGAREHLFLEPVAHGARPGRAGELAHAEHDGAAVGQAHLLHGVLAVAEGDLGLGHGDDAGGVPLVAGGVVPDVPGRHGNDGEGGEEHRGAQQLAPHAQPVEDGLAAAQRAASRPSSLLGPRESGSPATVARGCHGRASRRPEVEAGLERGEGQEGRRGPRSLPANDPGAMMEGMTMTRTSTEASRPDTGRRGAWRARALVLGPLAMAALATAAALGFGTDTALLGPLWLAAQSPGRCSPASRARSARVLRHGDWSAFGRHELPDGRDDRIDWISEDRCVRVSADPGRPRSAAARRRPSALTRLTATPSRRLVPPVGLGPCLALRLVRRPVGAVRHGVLRGAVELAGEPFADHRHVLGGVPLERLVDLDRQAPARPFRASSCVIPVRASRPASFTIMSAFVSARWPSAPASTSPGMGAPAA